MSLASSDRYVLAALNPRAMVGYLRSTGWSKIRDYGENAAVFGATIDGTSHELLVPVASQARDYVSVVELMIEDLAKVEGRPPYELASDLSMAAFDVVRIRSPDADDIGSVELLAGVELHEHARDLVLFAAAAAAAEKPKPVWLGRRSERVTDYVGSLRLGQSQRGSFVISLLSPWDFVPAIDRQQNTLGFADPFGRRATKTLASVLEAVALALRKAATEGIEKPFEAAVRFGVSANICTALAQLTREGEGATVSIRWSSTKPCNGEPTLRLTREDAQALTEAAERLSSYEPLPDVTISGVITNIKEEPSAFDGVTTIEALLDNRLRRVQVDFAKDDSEGRDALIDAFRKRKRVSVTGEIIREGRRLRLENPRGLVMATIED